jgi:hypothetical protein
LAGKSGSLAFNWHAMAGTTITDEFLERRPMYVRDTPFFNNAWMRLCQTQKIVRPYCRSYGVPYHKVVVIDSIEILGPRQYSPQIAQGAMGGILS